MGSVFRAVKLGHWIGMDPLPRDRSVLLDEHGKYPAGRWNPPDQDALYASFDADVAFEEQAQHFRPGSAAESWLGAHSVRQEIVVVGLEEPRTPPWTFDGRSRQDDSFWGPCMTRREPGDDPAVVYALTRLYGSAAAHSGVSRLIVPSAVRYTPTGPLDWNSIWFIGGPGQVRAADLPRKRDLRFTFQRQA